MMKLFAKIVDSIQPLTIFTKTSILDVQQGSQDVSEGYRNFCNNNAKTGKWKMQWK